jgi:hypothetical protein
VRPKLESAEGVAEFTRISITPCTTSRSLGTPRGDISTLSVAVIEGNRLFGLNVGGSASISPAGRFPALARHVINDRTFSRVLQRAIGARLELSRTASRPNCATATSPSSAPTASPTSERRRPLEEARPSHPARAIVQRARELATDETLDDAVRS